MKCEEIGILREQNNDRWQKDDFPEAVVWTFFFFENFWALKRTQKRYKIKPQH